MKYNLEIDGHTTPLAVTPSAEGRFEVASSDSRHAVTVHRIDDGHLFLTVDGVGCNAFVSGDGEAKQILINGSVYQVTDADARARRVEGGPGAHRLPREVTPPMPSVVVKILVDEGQPVQPGDPLVVVTAMKMETTLAAPFKARVARINVAVGDKVMPGDILVDLEAAADKETAEA
jgi:biotin carboxyl carrier protein